MKLEYQEIELDKVVDTFVKGYGKSVYSWEYFIDTAKKTVIIKLFVKEKLK